MSRMSEYVCVIEPHLFDTPKNLYEYNAEYNAVFGSMLSMPPSFALSMSESLHIIRHLKAGLTLTPSSLLAPFLPGGATWKI